MMRPTVAIQVQL